MTTWYEPDRAICCRINDCIGPRTGKSLQERYNIRTGRELWCLYILDKERLVKILIGCNCNLNRRTEIFKVIESVSKYLIVNAHYRWLRTKPPYVTELIIRDTRSFNRRLKDRWEYAFNQVDGNTTSMCNKLVRFCKYRYEIPNSDIFLRLVALCAFGGEQEWFPERTDLISAAERTYNREQAFKICFTLPLDGLQPHELFKRADSLSWYL